MSTQTTTIPGNAAPAPPAAGASTRRHSPQLGLSRRTRLIALACAGVAAAAVDGVLTAGNPQALPPGAWAIAARVVIVLCFVGAGVFALTRASQERMGWLLGGAGLFAGVWMLNGAQDRLAFSLGELAMGFAVPVYFFLMLAYPGGRLHGRPERRIITWLGGLTVIAWTLPLLVSGQPAARVPLLRCGPHCTPSLFALGSAGDLTPWMTALVRGASLVLPVFAAVILVARLREARTPLRRSLAPVVALPVVYLLALGGFLLALRVSPTHADLFAWITLVVVALIPLAMLGGLALERLYMGQALERLVNRLGDRPALDLEQLLREALEDPRLTIAFRRPAGDHIDSAGAALDTLATPPGFARTTISRDGEPIALVFHDEELAYQRRFIQAAGSASAIWFQNAQLQAELRASIRELRDSRARVIEAADTARRRIERDLHDGAQQHLVGARIGLELIASELERGHPREAEARLRDVGAEIDRALEELRSLAHGLYPPLLRSHGLVEALRSAVRHLPYPVDVEAVNIERLAPDAEAAVYFCCMEALQNSMKHAAGAGCAVRLWQGHGSVHFEVADSGPGFYPAGGHAGSGLSNMRDRAEAAGGIISVSSRPGAGTSVVGSIPVSRP